MDTTKITYGWFAFVGRLILLYKLKFAGFERKLKKFNY